MPPPLLYLLFLLFSPSCVFFPLSFSSIIRSFPYSQESWRRTSRSWSSSPWCSSSPATLPVSTVFSTHCICLSSSFSTNKPIYSDFGRRQKSLSALFLRSIIKSPCFLDGAGVSLHVSSDKWRWSMWLSFLGARGLSEWEDVESGVWFSCKGERLTGEGSGSLKVSEASLSHEGHSSNNLKQLRTKAPVQQFPAQPAAPHRMLGPLCGDELWTGQPKTHFQSQIVSSEGFVDVWRGENNKFFTKINRKKWRKVLFFSFTSV